MLRVNWPTERTGKGAPGKSSPADFAFTCPRPPLRSFTKEYSNKKAPLKPLRQQRGLCRFFGANSVASALGIRSGATPCGLIQPNIQLRNTRSKPDILTLLGLGHFYFALTGGLPPMKVEKQTQIPGDLGRGFRRKQLSAPRKRLVSISPSVTRSKSAAPSNWFCRLSSNRTS